MPRLMSRAERLYRAGRLLLVSARANVEAGGHLSAAGLSDEADEATRLALATSVLKEQAHAAEQAEDTAAGGTSKRARGISNWPVS